jgi:hypothetical protein
LNYNLTPKQRDLLKDIVEEVRAGNLDEEFLVTWLPGGIPYFYGSYRGKKPLSDLTEINVMTLKREELLNAVGKDSNYKCSPSEYGRQAVDSDFGASIAPSTATSSVAVKVNDVALVQLLEEHFDLNDLDELCFKMGVKHENVRGDTLSLRCRNLVSYMARRGQLMSLIISAVKERPNADWSSLY